MEQGAHTYAPAMPAGPGIGACCHRSGRPPMPRPPMPGGGPRPGGPRGSIIGIPPGPPPPMPRPAAILSTIGASAGKMIGFSMSSPRKCFGQQRWDWVFLDGTFN